MTFRRPQEWHTETAFVDQAVVKFMRGPTSKIKWGETRAARWATKLLSEQFPGSKVSARSHLSRLISSFVSGLSAATLKQNSVSILRIAVETFFCAIDSKPAAW